jgi:hypothetical protein
VYAARVRSECPVQVIPETSRCAPHWLLFVGRAVFHILFGVAFALPRPYRAENPAEFWSGGGGEWASLVAGVRSVGSDGCQKIRPKRRRKPAATPL